MLQLNALVFGLATCFIINGNALELKLTRASCECVEKYATNCSAIVTKHNRTEPYVFNFRAIITKLWQNNISMEMTSYEFKDNRYKESIIKYKVPLCDWIHYDKFLWRNIKVFCNVGETCPVPAGNIIIKDMILLEKYFPKAFPAGKWKLCTTYTIAKTNVFLAIVCLELEAKETLKYKKRKSNVQQ